VNPLHVLTYPHPLLVAKNRPLAAYGAEEAERVREMFELLYRQGGVGLSAPQVGWNVQLFILNLTGKKELKSQEQIVYNPLLATFGPLVTNREGCLSFPGISAEISRPSLCRIVGRTPEGLYNRRLTGFAAQAVQHEMDHLQGILFHERMTPEDRERHGATLQAMADSRES
jgi:peptide deformylase